MQLVRWPFVTRLLPSPIFTDCNRLIVSSVHPKHPQAPNCVAWTRRQRSVPGLAMEYGQSSYPYVISLSFTLTSPEVQLMSV